MATDIPAAELNLARDLCGRYRLWAPGERTAPRPRRLLGGGYSNRSVLLEGERERYVLRIGASPAPPGVDRVREAELAAAAAAEGAAPALLYSDSVAGVMITRYAGADLAAAPRSAELLALLRAIHGIPVRGAVLESGDQLERYRALLTAASPVTALLKTHAAVLRDARDCLAASARAAVTCHNDLLPANLRRAGGRLLAIDWEYAAAGDPFFDLAVCASELPDTAVNDFLEAYLQRPATAVERREFHAQRLHYAAIACCWYAVHLGDGDASQHACAHFGGLVQAAASGALL